MEVESKERTNSDPVLNKYMWFALGSNGPERCVNDLNVITLSLLCQWCSDVS